MQRVTALLIAAVCLLLAGSAGGSVFALSTVNINMYPDFNVAASTDTGCTALTAAVSSSTGALDSSSPTVTLGEFIDQEDTSYNSGASGASFCSFDYTGSTFTLTSVAATLFLVESGPPTDSWPI